MSASQVRPPTFQEDLTYIINKHSIENKINMPDFMLAEMICNLIDTIGPAVIKRDDHMGYTHKHKCTCEPVAEPEASVVLQLRRPDGNKDSL